MSYGEGRRCRGCKANGLRPCSRPCEGFKGRMVHKRDERSPAGYLCGPECRHHGGRRSKTKRLTDFVAEIVKQKADGTLDYWGNASTFASPLRSEQNEGGHEMAKAIKTSKQTTEGVLQIAKGAKMTRTQILCGSISKSGAVCNLALIDGKPHDGFHRGGGKKWHIGRKADVAPKMTPAERMAHARAVSKAKREAAAQANSNLTLAEVKASKKAAAAARLAKAGEEDREVQNERARELVAGAGVPAPVHQVEKIGPTGHGLVDAYYLAECLTCGATVKVPVDEAGHRIPLGDIKLVDGVLVGESTKNGKANKPAKQKRAKRDLTDEQRQAIADRLQGARAAKIGLTLEGLRILKLRPGTLPTAAQLKKYGVKAKATPQSSSFKELASEILGSSKVAKKSGK